MCVTVHGMSVARFSFYDHAVRVARLGSWASWETLPSFFVVVTFITSCTCFLLTDQSPNMSKASIRHRPLLVALMLLGVYRWGIWTIVGHWLDHTAETGGETDET